MANRIKKLRTARNISTQELATHTGIARSTLGSYETRGINPNAEKAQILADYFEVSVPYLLGFTNTQKEETQGFDTIEEFEKNRQKIFDDHKYNPHTGLVLKQTFESGKVLKKIEVVESNIRDRYKEVAKNLVHDLSDENNEKWLEYGRLLIQEQKRKENL
ncbi:helix-turn-helix domain-containing protein [Lactococcus formosensis]|uniref:Helix-turn-helix domain-containing protein n=1 Tax=Lactococcus formosensis TaxID=1281486 RepID=A0A9X4P734_9LACT|nr:helix-turn-helix transcriptional regulator [Lactococcus formosensis]MDG6142024.1 helix-turn-helix domain-containing protein [Lactococcus formosensis]MDG6159228.1 helix-turn-helix domain-containing protein [Lactococcus formosensis]MDG6165463.1 helix-turn-helix domain-containing protein [Lactococcus formosensis]MDG6171916.1 helix-turn-helix domain-containing protein [Lactococcus formosensis]MDG6192682.1 helix-turn-helix domain-containing protein [Lactococcus formosensis]